MASGIAARSRDVYAAVEWIDFYSGFKEMLLDDRGFPRLMHTAVQTSPLCLAYYLPGSWTAKAKEKVK